MMPSGKRTFRGTIFLVFLLAVPLVAFVPHRAPFNGSTVRINSVNDFRTAGWMIPTTTSTTTTTTITTNSKRKSAVSLCQQRSNNNNNQGDGDVLGISGRGVALFLFVFVVNVWLFSIPPEFRRAKNCTAEQVLLYPDSNCMTTEMWWGGVLDYYRNGGGIKFDFSIEGRE